MVRPSNPRLMARVLEAVTHLCNGKGSTSREVLELIRQNSNLPARNLAMQVHRALKHAVNAGLLLLRGGRYKTLVILNPSNPTAAPGNNNGSKDEGINDATPQVPNGLDRSLPVRTTEARSRSRCENCRKRRKPKRHGRTRRKVPAQKRRGRRSSENRRRETRRTRRKGDDEDKPRRRRGKGLTKRDGRDDEDERVEVPTTRRTGKSKVTDPDKDPETNTDIRMRIGHSETSSESADDRSRHKRKHKLASIGRKTVSPPRRSARRDTRRRSRRRTFSQHHSHRPMDSPESPMECGEDPGQVNARNQPETDVNTGEPNSGSGSSL